MKHAIDLFEPAKTPSETSLQWTSGSSYSKLSTEIGQSFGQQTRNPAKVEFDTIAIANRQPFDKHTS